MSGRLLFKEAPAAMILSRGRAAVPALNRLFTQSLSQEAPALKILRDRAPVPASNWPFTLSSSDALGVRIQRLGPPASTTDLGPRYTVTSAVYPSDPKTDLGVVQQRLGTALHGRLGTEPQAAIVWDVGRGDNPALSYATVFAAVGQSDILVHRGLDLPEEVLERIRASNIRYLRFTEKSPKRTMDEFVQAARLGDLRLSKENARIFDALPQAADKLELGNMDLPQDQASDWRRLRSRLASLATSTPFALERATKSELMNELRNGSNNVAVLIAHNENGTLYLSGAGGEKITLSEFAELKRAATPNRAVVLVTCSAGTVNQNVESIAEILIQNKLADAVFASPKDVDARTVPELLLVLSEGKAGLDEVLRQRGYLQIVLTLPREGLLNQPNASSWSMNLKAMERAGLRPTGAFLTLECGFGQIGK